MQSSPSCSSSSVLDPSQRCATYDDQLTLVAPHMTTMRSATTLHSAATKSNDGGAKRAPRAAQLRRFQIPLAAALKSAAGVVIRLSSCLCALCQSTRQSESIAGKSLTREIAPMEWLPHVLLGPRRSKAALDSKPEPLSVSRVRLPGKHLHHPSRRIFWPWACYPSPGACRQVNKCFDSFGEWLK